MASESSDAGGRAAAASARTGGVLSTALVLGVTVLPALIVMVMQALHLGLATNIGSDIQTTDSAAWVSCQSTFANGHLDDGVQWCARRPLAFMLPAPVYLLSPYSLAGAMLVQVVILGAAAGRLLTRITTNFAPHSAVTLLSAAALVWLIVQYGTSAGPEALALLLSLLAASTFLTTLATASPWWGAATTTLTAGAFLARPGNPVLLLVVVAAVAVVVARGESRKRVAAAVVAPVLLLFFVLNRVLRAVGIPEAGHGSNFWATVHSAAGRNMVGWTEVYNKYAAVAEEMGTETLAFATFLRNETLSLLISDPLPFAVQFIKNLGYFVLRGFINLFSGFPLRRRSQLSTLEGIARGEEPVWQLSAVPLGMLVAAALALSALSLWLLIRYGRHFAQGYRQSRLAGATRIRSPFATFLPASSHELAVLVGAAAVFGAFAFFGVVGHDEDSRHLVMSVPWAILGTSALLARSNKRHGDSGVHAVSSRLPLTVGLVLLAVAVAISTIDAAHRPLIITVAEQCDAEVSSDGRWQVVASAPMGTESRLSTGSDWRRAGVDRTRHTDTPLFMSDGILSLSGGHLVSLRSAGTGSIWTVFLPDNEVGALGDPIQWIVAPGELDAAVLQPCR